MAWWLVGSYLVMGCGPGGLWHCVGAVGLEDHYGFCTELYGHCKISSIPGGESARQINLRATSSEARLRGLWLVIEYAGYVVHVHEARYLVAPCGS